MLEPHLRPYGLPCWVCFHCHHAEPSRPLPFWGAHQEELRLHNEMIQRMRSASAKEVAALAAMGDVAIPAMVRIAEDRVDRQRALEVLGKIGTPTAINAAWEIITVLYGRFKSEQGRLTSVPTLAKIGSLFRRHKNIIGVQKPRSWGAIALACQDENLRPFAAPILMHMLPLMTTEDACFLHADEERAVVRLLGYPDSNMVRAALHAVGLFGGENELAQVRNVGVRHQHLLNASQEAAHLIEERIALTREKSHLLRASSGATGSSESLLRQTVGPGDSAPEQLLRPGETE